MRSRPPVPIALVAALGAATAACGDGAGGRVGREIRTRDVAVPPRAAREASCVVPGEGAGAPTRWTVAPGDTLASIARRCYGDERLWTEIVRANPALMAGGAEPRLRPGMVLAVPDVVR